MPGLSICSLFSLVLAAILHFVSFCEGRPSQIVLYSESGEEYNVNARTCKAGIFLPESVKFTCACVYGVWGLYSKFCKRPEVIFGGSKTCFALDIPRLTQVIPFGYVRYPERPSITHFREKFDLMRKSYYTDVYKLEIDIPATFITITGTPWTVIGDTDESVCLESPEFPANETDIFCYYEVTSSEVDEWLFITGIERGCRANVVVVPVHCYPVLPPNEDCSAAVPEPIDGRLGLAPPATEPPENITEAPFEFSPYSGLMALSQALEPTTEANNVSTTTQELTTEESTSTTTEQPSETCHEPEGLQREHVKRFWPSNHVSKVPCSPVLHEVDLTDSLRRFATFQMWSLVRSRQNSLYQMSEIFRIHAELIKTTCPHQALPHDFVDAMTEAFTWLIADDFFYGVEEFEASLFERVLFALRTCIANARSFHFDEEPGPCNITKLRPWVHLDRKKLPVTVPETERWEHYEVLIETGWKMFLNAHSYCYKHFYRQNDHHSYSLKLLQIFSTTVFEKWKKPMQAPDLYKFIVPLYDVLNRTLSNQDLCVAAIAHVSNCPVWMDRSSTRGLGLGKRKRRSIWINKIKKNRAETDMWGGKGFCLRSPDDPSYRLGFGRCAHP